MNWFRKLKRQDAIRLGACLGLVFVISVLHFGTSTQHLYLHDLFEHLYYVPVLLIALWYGALAGIGFALLTSAIYLVHIVRDLAPYTLLDPLTHLFLYNLMAFIVGLLSSRAHRNLIRFQNATAELSEAYEELKDTSQSLKRSERLAALGQLSAGIAHEIRNPLGSIKGAVEILASEIPSSHPKQEFVAIVRQEVARINGLVEEFLRFARPPEPKFRPIKVSDLVGSAIRLVEGHASRHKVEIICTCEENMISADEDQIRQVLLNLLLNSIEAMPQGGTLRVKSGRNIQAGSTTLEFSDTGGGAEGVDLDNIFDPFYTTKPQGTGLGLSVSHQLVRNHGGSLTAQRNAEGGLTLTVHLPSCGRETEGSDLQMAVALRGDVKLD